MLNIDIFRWVGGVGPPSQLFWAPENPKADTVGWLCGHTNGDNTPGNTPSIHLWFV